jgi:hypothetical protein
VEASALGAWFPADLGLLPEALVAKRKPALPVVDITRRLARDASRAVEWVVFAAIRAIIAAVEVQALGAPFPADLGLLPEALVAKRRPALPVVDIARRLARDASRAVERVVFAVCAMVYPVASMVAFRFRV